MKEEVKDTVKRSVALALSTLLCELVRRGIAAIRGQEKPFYTNQKK